MLEAFRPWQEDSSNNKAAVHPQVNAEHCSLVNLIIGIGKLLGTVDLKKLNLENQRSVRRN